MELWAAKSEYAADKESPNLRRRVENSFRTRHPSYLFTAPVSSQLDLLLSERSWLYRGVQQQLRIRRRHPTRPRSYADVYRRLPHMRNKAAQRSEWEAWQARSNQEVLIKKKQTPQTHQPIFTATASWGKRWAQRLRSARRAAGGHGRCSSPRPSSTTRPRSCTSRTRKWDC